MSTFRASLPILGLALTTGACTFDADGVDGSPALDSQLHTRAFLDLAPSSQVGVVAHGPSGAALPYVEPRVEGGRAVLRTTEDGWLLVEDLEIELADVVIPPGELGEDALVLTDVELRLGTQIAVEPLWAGDGMAAWGTGDADLLLDWSWILHDGSAYPLATQRLGEAEFTVAVTLEGDGSLTAQVHTTMPGEFHRLNGLVSFSDLAVSVDAVDAAID